MKREDIETAAKEYTNKITGLDFAGEVEVERAFCTGANWRINSVWHDVSEKPKNGKMIIVLRSKYSLIVCGSFNFYWKETVETFGLKKWAYTEDLIPNTED